MNYIAQRRQEEKDRRRSEILDAAEAVAAAEGIEALSMEQVARRARISRALLYVYFRDRTDLHFGLCERALALLHSRFEQASARPGDGLACISALGRAYVAFAAEFPVYFQALARFQAHPMSAVPGPGTVADCLAVGKRVHRLLIAAIDGGQRDGSIAPNAGSPPALAMTLWCFMYGITQLISTQGGVLGEYGLDSRALIEQALKLTADGLRPGKA